MLRLHLYDVVCIRVFGIISKHVVELSLAVISVHLCQPTKRQVNGHLNNSVFLCTLFLLLGRLASLRIVANESLAKVEGVEDEDKVVPFLNLRL